MLVEEELEMSLAQHHTEVGRGESKLFGRFRLGWLIFPEGQHTPRELDQGTS
jgi:hypothetical protein